MHALILDGAVAKYPYTIGNLRKDNQRTSFPKRLSDEALQDWNVYVVARVDRPDVDYTKNVNEGTPVLQGYQWTQVWDVTEASAEEIAQRKAYLTAQAEANRAEAYRTESDPLFFKWQRGSATEQEWLDAVAAIKARYLDPV